MMNSQKQSNTITALVIAAMEPNWARHYLRGVGISKTNVERILTMLTEGDRLTGDVRYAEFVIDTMTS